MAHWFQILLGYKSNSSAAELILEGQYTDPELDKYTQNLLNHLKQKATTELPKANSKQLPALAGMNYNIAIWYLFGALQDSIYPAINSTHSQ